MIFKQIEEIYDQRKTQTRRVVKPGEYRQHVTSLSAQVIGASHRVKWETGKTYAIQRKRGAMGTGNRILLTVIRMEGLHNITEADAIAEGVASVEEYKALWNSINGKTKGARWDDNPMCWVLEFELVKDGA